MAKRRELKKNVNYIAGELFSECLINSMFGPLEASLGYSNQSKDVGFYVNLGFSF